MNLSDVNAGQEVVISHIEGSGAFRARLSEMGFVTGKSVRKVFSSPVGNPIVFELMGGQIALRKSEAEKIQVRLPDEQGSTPEPPTGQPHSRPAQPADAPSASRPPHAGGCPHCGTHSQHLTTDSPKADGTITIALVGNPNCGKTSLFNAASGGHERTGNYSGVTVSSVVGEMVFEGRRIRLVDLPGTYSLRAFSPEEA